MRHRGKRLEQLEGGSEITALVGGDPGFLFVERGGRFDVFRLDGDTGILLIGSRRRLDDSRLDGDRFLLVDRRLAHFRLERNHHTTLGGCLLAVRLPGPQRQLVVPRWQPRRDHDELSRTICHRSIMHVTVAQ